MKQELHSYLNILGFYFYINCDAANIKSIDGNDSIFNVNVELIFSCDFHEFPLVYIFYATQLNASECNYTELYVVMILNFMHDKFSGPHQRNLNL